MAKSQPVKFIDNPNAPEIFASAATGFFVADGNVSITFKSARADHTESPARCTAMPWRAS